MPTYVYRFVETGETIEVQQAFTDEALTEAAHPATGDLMAVKKVFTPVGVTFKGTGFYKTDSRSGARPKTPASGSSGDGARDSAATKDAAPATTGSSSGEGASSGTGGSSPGSGGSSSGSSAATAPGG